MYKEKRNHAGFFEADQIRSRSNSNIFQTSISFVWQPQLEYSLQKKKERFWDHFAFAWQSCCNQIIILQHTSLPPPTFSFWGKGKHLQKQEGFW
jgi:hypothetical protein